MEEKLNLIFKVRSANMHVD